MTAGRVRPEDGRLTEYEFRSVVADIILRLTAADGPGGLARLALRVGCDERTLRNAREGRATLSAPTLFNLLAVDPQALAPLLARFGLVAAPIEGTPGAGHAALLADTAGMAARIADALRDGQIDHGERQVLADAARDLIPDLQGLVQSADAARLQWGRA